MEEGQIIISEDHVMTAEELHASSLWFLMTVPLSWLDIFDGE